VTARALIHDDVAHNDVTARDMQMTVVRARPGRLLLAVYTRRIISTYVKQKIKIIRKTVKIYRGMAKLTLVTTIVSVAILMKRYYFIL
jgi:hypothetical protein